MVIESKNAGQMPLILGLLALAVFLTPVFPVFGQDTIAPIGGVSTEAAEPPVLTLKLEGSEGTAGMDSALKIVLLMTVLSLAPAFLILLTSFTRIVIVLGFLRQAIGAN